MTAIWPAGPPKVLRPTKAQVRVALRRPTGGGRLPRAAPDVDACTAGDSANAHGVRWETAGSPGRVLRVSELPGVEAAEQRPVLLTVDDDPAVSRAVARDLRRQYGERFRVLRAASGAE